MRMVLAGTVFVACMMPVLNVRAEEPRGITIATEGASPPWDGTNEKGELYGYDIDVGLELCRRIKAECRFVAQDWDGIIPALLVGKYDVIMSGMAITEKRKKSIAFSSPYAAGYNQLVVRKELKLDPGDIRQRLSLSAIDDQGKAVIKRLHATLSGKTMGVLRSSNSEAVLKELFGDVVTLRSYDSLDNLKLDLAAGRVDGALADYFTWRDFLETPEGAGVTFFGPQVNGGLWGPGVGAGMRKDDGELLARFNSAIEAAARDGTIRALSLKWFKTDIAPAISQ